MCSGSCKRKQSMLRKRILLVLILGIVAWIITDLYKVIDLMKDGRYKIDFLESTYGRENPNLRYLAFDDYYQKSRPSVQETYQKFQKLNPESVNFSEELDWSMYIDEVDHKVFKKENRNILELNIKAAQQKEIWNRMIYITIINYAANRIGIGGQNVCYGGYSVVKDLYNNITLAYSCASYDYMTTVNGYTVEKHSYSEKIKIPVCDSIAVGTRAPNYQYRFSENPRDSISTEVVFDVRSLMR